MIFPFVYLHAERTPLEAASPNIGESYPPHRNHRGAIRGRCHSVTRYCSWRAETETGTHGTYPWRSGPLVGTPLDSCGLV